MANLDIPQRIELARKGMNPNIICQVSSGWVALCDMQYLRGYCILLADPVVESINHLNAADRAKFMLDMTVVGDSLLEVTGALRINYGMLSNSDPYLHAHIIPRYQNEPEEIRRHLPWSYSKEVMNGRPFDLNRDQSLMFELKAAIQNRLLN